MLAQSGRVDGFAGLLCIPLGSSLHDFSVRQYLEAEFGKIKAGQIKRLKVAEKNPRLWSRVRLLYINVRVNDNVASVDLVLNAPEDLLDQAAITSMQQNLLKRSRQLGVDDIDFNISIVPNRIYRFDMNPDLKS